MHVCFRITPPTVLIQRNGNFADSKTVMRSSAYYLEITLRIFLARVIVRYALCVMHCPSTLENKYSNILKTLVFKLMKIKKKTQQRKVTVTYFVFTSPILLKCQYLEKT